MSRLPQPDTPATPVAAELRRLTTRYVDSEDRLRVAGEVASGQVQVVWLTQRLLNRLLPHLWKWLDQAVQAQPRSHDTPAAALAAVSPAAQTELQRFAQQSAAAERRQQVPVDPSRAVCTLLVQSVDIRHLPAGVRLTFKAAAPAIGPVPTLVEPTTATEAVHLTLATPALRQWLQIVYQQYRVAEWPTGHWPSWIRNPSAAGSTAPAHAVLH